LGYLAMISSAVMPAARPSRITQRIAEVVKLRPPSFPLLNG
jgi:hypothetical protein